MKALKFILSLAALTLLASSCNKNEENGSAGDRNPVRLSVPTATRAAGDSWTAGDPVGIRMLDASDAVAEGYSNQQYKATVSGTSTGFEAVGDEMYYPMDGSTVNFAAYYPYTSALNGNTITIDVSNQSNPEDIDLLWAKTTAGYTKTHIGSVPLEFNHMLSRFIIHTVAGEGLDASDLVGMNVRINGLNTRATFDIGTAAITSDGTSSATTPYTRTDGVIYETICLPDSYIGNISVEFTINPSSPKPETFRWNPSSPLDFAQGKEQQWVVTLSRTGVEGIQGSINDWQPGTGGTGVAN